MHVTTWRKDLVEALAAHGERFADIIASTLTEEEMDREFDAGPGEIGGCPFTLWTIHRVYFPAGTDNGDEWVDSVSRLPDGLPTKHKGR